MGALAWSIAEQAPLERRRNQRVKVRLAGRFMRSDRLEFDCETIDMSPGGIASRRTSGSSPANASSPTSISSATRGQVARTFPSGFAIQMNFRRPSATSSPIS